ncbi:MAG: triose-phosphate isomerase [Kangiellaceae bacterium]|jgi:triosephosphate isomerase|nr:triose-phosphate isomerase [Kangiellaceae bacterium]
MRKNIVAGNWKMNKTVAETEQLVADLKSKLQDVDNGARVIIAPSFVSLTTAVTAVKGSEIEVAAQNMHQEANGAYTGEVSAEMLKSAGVNTVIIGHSERREYFKESDELLASKVDAVLANGMEVIFCFGETLKDRKLDNQLLEVGSQIKKSLFHLPAEAWKNIVLAYEPVWAIGTGETATPEQAQEMHKFVRRIVSKKYTDELADDISILYGGSVKPNNAKEIFSKPDVDGGLIGGASLKADDFLAIVNGF